MDENVQIKNDEIKPNGKREKVTPPNLAKTMRSFRVELQSCGAGNERVIKSKQEKSQLNSSIL